ncbi:MAG: 2'-5' RNA ligase family protein [Ferruginibacter sp.]
MEKNIKGMLGYKINEYLLVLNPHEELRNRIMHIKQDFHQKFKATTALYSMPQVILVSFVQYEIYEDRIVNRLKSIAMGFHPVKIELKDYGSFPSHTIYINVTSKMPIQSLVKKIREDAQRLMKFDKENKPHFMDNSYLTIARKLLPWQYEQGWLEYGHKQFTGRFIADAMLLIKRRVGEMKFQVVQRFQFENLPVNTTQGELFM